MTGLLRILAAVLALTSSLAYAGDGNYDDIEEHRGPAFYGVASDTRGKTLADVSVVLRAKNHEPIVLKTTVLGLYRTHIDKDVKPEDVQVTCQKDGYKTTRVVRRGIQTNCTLEAL